MKLQLLSDLHLESERFEAEPAPAAELLILAGDIDARWDGYARFAGWPVPVVAVAGNHEFDHRELDTAWPALRAACARHGVTLLERETLVAAGADGRRVRFAGTVRWNDFDCFGPAQRPRGGRPLDAVAIRTEALDCRAWLERTLAEPARGRWDATVVVTHYAPSLRSADPRYGRQPGTASFCNADDDLLPRADLWLHGHLHCRHDYRVGGTRVVCNARGVAAKGETDGYDGSLLLDA